MAEEEALVLLQNHLPNIRIPTKGDKIYKDECVFSFDTPETETGLYVCLNTFYGYGQKHVEWVSRKTGNYVYLHMKRIKKEIPQEPSEDEKKKPTKLALGIEGGFDGGLSKKYEYEEYNTVVVLPQFAKIELPNEHLPEKVRSSVAGILAAESANKVEEAQALSGTWDGEKRQVSKHAKTLVQLDNGVKIPPKGWKCLRCDKTDNLWLNLSDGSILCGRRFFDGSGGNNHALHHYQETGYPLVVKLGTITPDGGDVYSYDEDDMVEDPYLAQHLAHFGINIAQMEKTDKSMIELEIDMNQRIGEWAIIQESDCKLTPLYGPGYTGLANLGNSCYMNSVLQVLFSIPDFQTKYFDGGPRIFENSPPNPTQDFNVQMAKLAVGLLSGDYSKPPEDPQKTKDADECQPGIKPHMFKNLIGKGHPEFSTKRQQDAQEFLLHFINIMERNCRGEANPADSFKFEVQEKIQCVKSQKVKYTSRTDYMLSLPIPLESMINRDAVAAFEVEKAAKVARGEKVDPNAVVRPSIPMLACLEAFAAPEPVEDFYSTALEAKSLALKTTRLRTFPDYLFLHLKKFEIGDDWVPKKLNVSVQVPDELDLSSLRGTGLQPGEEELPESGPEPAAATGEATGKQENEFEYDAAVFSQLCDMGFPADACKRAIYNTGNSGIEPAMNWIMEHMNDPDFAVPFSTSSDSGSSNSSTTGGGFVPNSEAVLMITSMGFTQEQAIKALKATDNNVECAAEWLFNHPEEMDTSEPPVVETYTNAPSPTLRDGNEKYKLVAFISHMGTSTMVGHYLCHILRDGRWVIYNDNKVAISEHPPKDLAYLYLYKRA